MDWRDEREESAGAEPPDPWETYGEIVTLRNGWGAIGSATVRRAAFLIDQGDGNWEVRPVTGGVTPWGSECHPAGEPWVLWDRTLAEDMAAGWVALGEWPGEQFPPSPEPLRAWCGCVIAREGDIPDCRCKERPTPPLRGDRAKYLPLVGPDSYPVEVEEGDGTRPWRLAWSCGHRSRHTGEAVLWLRALGAEPAATSTCPVCHAPSLLADVRITPGVVAARPAP